MRRFAQNGEQKRAIAVGGALELFAPP